MSYEKSKTFCKLLIANLVVFLTVLLVVEIGGQIYVYFHPSYKILPFIPHQVLGWGFIPNSKHIMTGDHWYSREFSSKIKINSHGFRDFNRPIRKDRNSIRIAILGDSMVAGRQLEFDVTAGQLLEKKLKKFITPKTGKTYEVLNFGIPGFGVDQMYLNWEHYASKFNPDYVFIYLFEKDYLRTISSVWCQRGFLGVDNIKEIKCLNIRPQPSIDSKPPVILNQKNWSKIDSLETSSRFKDILLFLEKLPLKVYLPTDYEVFMQQQKKYMEKELNGQRILKRTRKVFLIDIFSNIKNKIILNTIFI